MLDALENYRKNVVRETNRNLRTILAEPEVEAAHDFRVGVKRLTALYYFLSGVADGLDSKQVLKPYRVLFKSAGRMREGHIAYELVEELQSVEGADRRTLLKAIRLKVRQDFRSFQSRAGSGTTSVARLPGIMSMGLTDARVLRHRERTLREIRAEVSRMDGRLSADAWHVKRILLKRYRHTMEAFQAVPELKPDEDEMKLIKLIEQLLGDWHDHVATISYVQKLPVSDAMTRSIAQELRHRQKMLLGSAKIYLSRFAQAGSPG